MKRLLVVPFLEASESPRALPPVPLLLQSMHSDHDEEGQLLPLVATQPIASAHPVLQSTMLYSSNPLGYLPQPPLIGET